MWPGSAEVGGATWESDAAGRCRQLCGVRVAYRARKNVLGRTGEMAGDESDAERGNNGGRTLCLVD